MVLLITGRAEFIGARTSQLALEAGPEVVGLLRGCDRLPDGMWQIKNG